MLGKVSKQSWRIVVVGAVGELGAGNQTPLAECRLLTELENIGILETQFSCPTIIVGHPQ